MKYLAVMVIIICIFGCVLTTLVGFAGLAFDNLRYIDNHTPYESPLPFVLAMWGLGIVAVVGGCFIFKAPARAATILLGVGLVLLFMGLVKSGNGFTALGAVVISAPFNLAGILAWVYASYLPAKNGRD
jgi:hypothetical protein